MAFHRQAGERLEELEGLDVLASGWTMSGPSAWRGCDGRPRSSGGCGAAGSRAVWPGCRGGIAPLAMPAAGSWSTWVETRPADDVRELSGEEVTFLLAANPGEPLLPLSKVASGGELARAMLALRLVLLGTGGGAARRRGHRRRP